MVEDEGKVNLRMLMATKPASLAEPPPAFGSHRISNLAKKLPGAVTLTRQPPASEISLANRANLSVFSCS